MAEKNYLMFQRLKDHDIHARRANRYTKKQNQPTKLFFVVDKEPLGKGLADRGKA